MNPKEIARWIWSNRTIIGGLLLVWYADASNAFHTEPVLESSAGTENVDVIGSVVKGIACFFGVC